MSNELFKFKFQQQGTSNPSTDSTSNFSNTFKESKLVLSDETFIDLRNVIYKLCGIYYTDSKKYLLEGRIAKRIVERNLNTFEDYVRLLESSSARSELNLLFEAITINETFFFRAEYQFEAFEKILVPEILKVKGTQGKPVFRIWSAASSTGEEAYTLAIIILEKLKPLYPNVQFQILASDINNAVLENAKKGIYREYAIRNIAPNLLNKYFTKNGTNYLLNDDVKRLVKFMNINLYDSPAMSMIRGCDIIFCCNVLIYFDIPSKQKVISHLYDSLNPNGYLFIGYSESLHGISKAFKLVHLPKAMAYKKE